MGRSKIAVTLDAKTLAEVDRLVLERRFPNRSQAIQEALDEKLARLSHTRLARECAMLDMAFEQAIVRPDAETDITEGALWYETQSPGLGSDFLRSRVRRDR